MKQLLTSEQINNAFHAMYSHNNFYYGTFPSIYRANKEVTLKALTKDGLNLAFSSSNLRNDKEVVLAAVSKISSALKLASDEIQLFCKGKDPVSSLKAAIAYEELNKDLQIKNLKEKKIKL